MADETTNKTPSTEREERILKFWEDNKAFEASLEQEAPQGEFVFYDGPPFATGLPHYGHVIASVLKDLIPRYKTMRGYRVRRRWGWDCHGLPVENLIEKELGFSGKKDIEAYGVEKFNAACRASVLRYAEEWRKLVPRVGRWVDMVDDYRTMDATYTESVWWVFKSLYDKGLVYEGFKSMQLCPRCETTLSNFEVNQGYKDITDISVYVKFELVDEPGTFLLAWTTTPWTLPGNAALAVNAEEKYGMYEVEGQKIVAIVARVEKIFEGKEFTLIKEFKGADLVGKSYHPVFNYYQNDEKVKNKENGWKVYAGDFVTTTDGSGIVHIAPAFGTDDYNLSLKENIPFIQHVKKDGTFKPEVTDFAGQYVKPKEDHQKGDVEIIKYLAKEGKLFKKEKIVHSYPHCWRCDTPLLNYATSSWFVKVTDIRDKMVAANNKVKWIPEAIGSNRFGNWLEEARDWNVSRQRYWGAPLPVWKCNSCESLQVSGSLEELRKQLKPRNNYYVMRHGEGEHNVAYVITSDKHKKYHLTENGREQAALTGLTLKDKHIDVIFASPLTRTRETAEIVVEQMAFKDEVIVDERLREYDFGDLDGKNAEEYHRFYNSVKEQLDKRLPNGENVRDVARRVSEFIYNIDAKYEGKNILIVTHDGPASMLFAAALGGGDKELINHWAGDFLETGHVKQLEFAALPHNDAYQVDFHRPYIDGVTFSCSCGGTFTRVPDVFDCWFESGSMPYGEVHYPFHHETDFVGKHFPADFIAEGLDQTRGWFYSLLVLGTALFNESPYKHVLVNGLILAEDGQKMSKSKNNYPPILPTIEKYSADALRYFLMQSPSVKAEDVCFSEKGVDEVNKKILLRLQNVVSFYELYANGEAAVSDSPNVLDQWIVAHLNETGASMTRALDAFEIDKGVRPLMDMIDDLSTWYLRRSRDRFKSDDVADKTAAIATTRYVLLELSKLIAPVMPFYAEELYQKVKPEGAKVSVHLEQWTEFVAGEGKLITKMKMLREIVEAGLSLRNATGVKVRQPLQSFTYEQKEGIEFSGEELAIIADELNVKEVKAGTKNELDTTITDTLRAEGVMRDLVRAVQDMRKKQDWQTTDRGNLVIAEKLKADVETFEDEIKKVAGIVLISYGEMEGEFELHKN
jgi:isoleucyl-tRNA synthetase